MSQGQPGTNFAVTEEDTLEGLLAFRQFSPSLLQLMDVLTTSHLLILGCRYPDWLARMFLRVARGKRLAGPRDETELISDAEPGTPLTLFLERFSTGSQVLPVTSHQLIAALAPALRTYRPPPQTGPVADSHKLIFVSYCNEDAVAARAIVSALRQCGLDVWLDKGDTPDALRPGESFDRRIRDQIAKCELFVPVLSRSAARRVEGYFRTEWGLAVKRQAGIVEDLPFLLPVRVDDVSYAESGIPLAIRSRHWIEMPGGAADESVVKQFVQSVRTVRARRMGGGG
jgi:hypothetical protein